MSLLLEINKEVLLQNRIANTNLTTERVGQIALSLNDFVLDAIDKFVKGEIEHGGDITNRDLDKEIRQETIDLFWYQQAKLWKK